MSFKVQFFSSQFQVLDFFHLRKNNEDDNCQLGVVGPSSHRETWFSRAHRNKTWLFEANGPKFPKKTLAFKGQMGTSSL